MPTSEPASPTAQQPPEEHDRHAQPVNGEESPRLPFPVVGIGASAGGLEAFTEFFKAMPATSGMAFVLVQHLPPDRESMIAEILGRHTRMTVLQVEDKMPVEANHVYVIRPGHTLTIKNGALHLGERLEKPGHSRPVDDLFRSLAEEQRERGIGIILSGMGSNGSAGAQAIKAVGGLCIAQDPESALFPSMPRHLIDAGYADYILRPRDMPDVLLGYAEHPYARGRSETDAAQILKKEQHHVREILAVLRTRTRQDFSGYKKPTILRRIQRRMGLHRVTQIGEYAKFLRQSPTEVTSLSDDLLIHVTGFFRDAQAWEALREQVIAPLVKLRASDESIRCWVTACSSGEEAYTLAMLLVEEAERANKSLDIKIFATDMADRSLQNARTGTYPGGIESEMPPERLERFFIRDDAIYRIRPELRERVIFAPQNLLQDPPFSRLDIATCRNLLIYLEPDVQHRVLELLHFGLREGGALFLGTSETVGGAEELFEPINKKLRIFRRIGQTRHGTVQFPLPRVASSITGIIRAQIDQRPPAKLSLAQLTTKALLEHHTPAAVTIDRDHRIVYYQGDTSKFLNQPKGEVTRDLMSLVRESLRGTVRAALQRAATQGSAVSIVDGWIETSAGQRARIAVTASPVDVKSAPSYFVVSFQELEERPAAHPLGEGNGNGDEVHSELQRVRDELQSTIEELQTSNEELKASNEEVMSVNEELQSSNEELETSREEMQSLNEELTTVNSQLQVKIEEHQAASNDLSSLLTSTDIAVLFLDANLRIRRFTPAMIDLLELRNSDVGRPLGDLARKFTDPELAADARAVLARLVPREAEIADEAGRWYLRRILPYRTNENLIDGIVITFVDITERKRAVEALRESEASLQTLADVVPDMLFRNDSLGKTEWYNRRWLEYTGQSVEDALGFGWLNVIHPVDREQARAAFQAALDRVEFLRMQLRIRGRDGAYRWFLFQARPILDKSGKTRQWYGAATDIQEQRAAIEELHISQEQFRLMVEGARDFAMFVVDPSGTITAWNPAAERMLGWTAAEAIGQPAGLIFTPEDRAAAAPEKELAEAAHSGRAPDERWHIKKDGTRFWGSGVMASLPTSEEGNVQYVKVLRDDTARKLAEDALHEAAQTAEIANRMKDEFLATLSHELRTPLAAITLWVKILRSLNIPQPDLQEGLLAIESGTEAQRSLIDDLLDTSRIATGKLQLRVMDMDLSRIVRSAIESIRPAAEAKTLTLEVDLDPKVGWVRADPDRLRQILWNLLVNASKFTPTGGRITVETKRYQKDVEIRIVDTGVGIPAELLPHIFERFRQGDSSLTRSAGGLGLGLAIVKQLVTLHGGTVTAQSEGAGRGAEFIIRLPLPRLSAGRTDRNPAEGSPESSLAKSTILLVEDDAATRYALVAALRGTRAHVEAVGSAAAGFEAFRSKRPDVILSDIAMPGGNGYEMLQQIRAFEATQSAPPVPAIALTAFARDEDRDLALENGFQLHMSKPTNPEELIAAIASVLRAK